MYDLDAKEAANLSTKITKFGEAFLFQLKKQTKTNYTHKTYNKPTNKYMHPTQPFQKDYKALCSLLIPAQKTKQTKNTCECETFLQRLQSLVQPSFSSSKIKYTNKTNNKQTNTCIKPFHTDHKARCSLPPQAQQTNKSGPRLQRGSGQP